MPQCALCGAKLPLVDLDQRKYSRDGKRICQRCVTQAIAASVKSPRFLPIPALPPAIPMQEPPQAGTRRTVRNVLSLSGLVIIVFTVSIYMPQYRYWVLLGSAALLAVYHPWWRHGIDKSKCDKILMDGEWRFVKKNSWRPVWTCESCSNPAIEQTESGQMLPCRSCGHENESFDPHRWRGELADLKDTGVVVNDEVMRRRESAALAKAKESS